MKPLQNDLLLSNEECIWVGKHCGSVIVLRKNNDILPFSKGKCKALHIVLQGQSSLGKTQKQNSETGV